MVIRRRRAVLLLTAGMLRKPLARSMSFHSRRTSSAVLSPAKAPIANMGTRSPRAFSSSRRSSSTVKIRGLVTALHLIDCGDRVALQVAALNPVAKQAGNPSAVIVHALAAILRGGSISRGRILAFKPGVINRSTALLELDFGGDRRAPLFWFSPGCTLPRHP